MEISDYRYTAEDIMKFFNISKQQLYVWRKFDHIEYKKVNGRTFKYKFPKKYGSTEIVEKKFPIYKSIVPEEVKPLEIRDFSVWYTADDIMEMFNVNRQMLRYWRLTGKIEFEKFNARVFRYKFPIL